MKKLILAIALLFSPALQADPVSALAEKAVSGLSSRNDMVMRVYRLMKLEGLRAQVGYRRKTGHYGKQTVIADNRLEQNFDTERRHSYANSVSPVEFENQYFNRLQSV
jgi:hypothetical protein